MHRYRNDHTGPKIQLGGLHPGFRRVGYQEPTDVDVASDPSPAAAKQMRMNNTSMAQRPITLAIRIPPMVIGILLQPGGICQRHPKRP